MPTTWTTVTTTGVWDALPPTAWQLLAEDDQPIRTEADQVILLDYLASTWAEQSNSTTVWTVI